MVQAEPESAAARAFLASAFLYETLARQGTLQSQLFVTSDEFLRQPRLPPDAELERSFRQAVEEAQRVARQRLEKHPDDADGLFALGLSYGALANYTSGVEARYLYGLRLGEKAFEHTQRLRRLHPRIEDTGIVLGVHDYVLGSLPRLHRFFLFFVGARGDRDRGIQYLEGAAQRGEYLRTYARVLLAVARIREGQLDAAASLLESLQADYPNNPLILFELARLYRQQQRYRPATQLCQELLAAVIAHPTNPRILGPEDVWLERARSEVAARELDAALESLRQVERVADADRRMLTWALLERGRIHDQRGERGAALEAYEKVIRLAADPEAARLAGIYKKEAYARAPGR